MLPLMMVYELNDVFFLKSFQSSQSFNILDYMSFSLSSTQSFGTKLQHQFSCNNKTRHFFFNRLRTCGILSLLLTLFSSYLKPPYFFKDYSGHTFLFTLTLQTYVPIILDVLAINVTLFLQSLTLTFNYAFLLLAVSILTGWPAVPAYILFSTLDSIPDFVYCKALWNEMKWNFHGDVAALVSLIPILFVSVSRL